MKLLVWYYTERIKCLKIFSKSSLSTEYTMEILFKIIITNSIILNCLFWSVEKSDEDKNLHII